SELRDALRGATPDPGDSGAAGLDTAEVIRRARAHRRPKQAAFGAVGALAVAGLASVGITAMPGSLSAPMSASDSGAEVESYSDGGAGFGPQSEAPEPEGSVVDRLNADATNSCGDEVAILPPNENGLVLTPHFPTTS